MTGTEERFLRAALRGAVEAAQAILEIYRTNFQVERKADSSPVTRADKEAHHILCTALAGPQPAYPVLSEEGRAVPYRERRIWERLWIVDPLDGTKEFVQRKGQFGVNVALVERGIPIMGVVALPLEDTVYFARKGKGAFKLTGAKAQVGTLRGDCGWAEDLCRRSIPLPLSPAARRKSDTLLRVIVSRSHMNAATEAFLECLRQRYGDLAVSSAGSSLI